jgi:hypothetical protein
MNTQEIISSEQVSSLERIAAIVAKSGMGGFKTPEQATVAMLLALAEGIPLGRIIHEYHVINGRLSLRSECMLARFQKAGGTVEYLVHNDTEVGVIASHPRGGSLTVTWTIERARKAGLTSNPTWAKHPAAMLTARAIAEAVRAVYPACLSGIIAEEEAEEVGTEGQFNRPSGALEPAPLPAFGRRRTRGNGSTAPAGIQLTPARPEAASEPEAAAPEAVTLTVVPEAPAPRPPELDLGHPLDSLLGGLNQEKLTAFLLRKGMIAEGQTYKWCNPDDTRRIQKQFPSFLKAAGFDEELALQAHSQCDHPAYTLLTSFDLDDFGNSSCSVPKSKWNAPEI